ncbi:MAG: PfkB family carbohydrate kinase [Anaerolineales bacterium]|jgi:sulfofructose kinase
MPTPKLDIDVLCVGHACFDLTFVVPHHPGPDEKGVADALVSTGGGPAANAAVTVARLGLRAAFAGYLGNDPWGDRHLQEFHDEGVNTNFIIRGSAPTPLSAILVKPDGKRTVINYHGETDYLPQDSMDFSGVHPRVLLFDGHQPWLSLALAGIAKQAGVPIILDAGSVHAGTHTLADQVDYLVCSEKFAMEYSGQANPEWAAARLNQLAPTIIITLGQDGLVWCKAGIVQHLPAFQVKVVDSTGAGDVFHGALAVGLAEGRAWEETLRYASSAAALSCTRLGARPGIPTRTELTKFLAGRLCD